MSDDPVSLHFEAIRQQIAGLQQDDPKAWTEIETVLEDLHIIYEQMQTNLEAALVVEQQLLYQQQHYYNLFQACPIAYLVTDASGLILDANQAVATLLNVPQSYLIGKPLVLYVAESDRLDFRFRLNQLGLHRDTQVWQMNFCPRWDKPFTAQLHIAINRTGGGLVESLRIAVLNLSQAGQATPRPAKTAPIYSPAQPQAQKTSQPEAFPISPLPYSLDGLRVLVVDDEAGICQFITALLESHGIGVKAVTSSAAALEEIDRFQPDVLLSDIRMAGGNGYDLIRQIRALEARQGRHIPAAAITAYVDEDREKALSAGYEAYWYKLSQPTELVEVVVQLAERLAQERS